MPVLILLCSVLTIAYAALMLVYRAGWHRQRSYVPPAGFRPGTTVSIIIPARNEAANIGRCLRSILDQQYPPGLLEVLVVDDHSTDDTAAVARSFAAPNVQVLHLADHPDADGVIIAYKKKALGLGVAHSTGDLIVTTDADCVAPPGWIRQLAALYEERHPAMIIAPVDFTADGSTVQLFQSLDFMTMQGITAAAHRLRLGDMANGANLCFSRTAFAAVNGYTGTDHLASGDDFLLLHKMRRQFPEGIHYLKSCTAIMRTAPQPHWRGFLQQRIRWASKSGRYPDHRLTTILTLVYLMNVAFVPALLAALVNSRYWWLPVGMLAVKTCAELIFLFPVARFFGKRAQLLRFPLLQPLHISYIILAGFLGLFGQYEWKGRQVQAVRPGDMKS